MKRFLHILSRRPTAAAAVAGSSEFPHVHGTVRFYQTDRSVLVAADIRGLPRSESGFFAFHIHEGPHCTGTPDDPFAHTLGHYNPCQQHHPRHAGDLPPLLCCEGRGLLVCLTGRFRAEEVIGRTVVIHAHPDDLMTQPSGGAGMKIACGEIKSCCL